MAKQKQVLTWNAGILVSDNNNNKNKNNSNNNKKNNNNNNSKTKCKKQKQDNHLESRDAGSSLVKTWTPVHPTEVGLCERNKSQHMIIFNDQNKIIFDQDDVMMRR